MIRTSRQSGFTAIELLITLFVAAAFLVAGYQLFNVVIKDGGQARAESRAANIAYDYMRRYSPSATNPCVPQTLLNDSPINVDGLSDAKITVVITCPDYTTTGLSKIDVTIIFGATQQTVKYSTFTTGTGSEIADVTDGLVGWWRFNGDANTAVGTADGTIINAAPIAGQNTLENNAYTFNGTTAEITVPNTFLATTITEFTLSAWTKLNSINGGNTVGIISKDISGSIANPPYSLEFTNAGFIWRTTSSANSSVTIICSAVVPATGVWYHLAGTFTGGVLNFYVNGTQCTGTPAQTNLASTTGLLRFGQQKTGTARWLNGIIDDIRIYDRALSTAEVLTLYNGGAK